MLPGEALLLVAFALAGAALASGAYALLGPGRSPPADRRSMLLGVAAAGLVALSFLTLVGHFAGRDFSVYAVWNYTDTDTPLYLRVAGAWAGSAGSVFLWTTLLGLAYAGETWWQRRAASNGEALPSAALLGVARWVTLAAFACFLFLTLRALPFAATVDFHFDAMTGFFAYQPGMRHLPDPLDFRAEGFGLNPLLVTPFMAIHPPMEFLAYAFTTLPFAFAVGWLVTRDPGWVGGAVFWGRLAWMCYAIALGLGALWAYYVLSFGGYWAWDPVEVGDLIPFLGLTAFLHAADMHRKGKAWHHYAPFLAGLVFPLTLFGTFVTRSSYWISAHAFDVGAAAVVVDPATRLLQVVAAKPQTAAILALLLLVLGGLACLHLLRFLRGVVMQGKRGLALPTLAVLAAYLVVMAFAALDVHGLVAQGFALAGVVGGGNLLLGLAVLGLLLLGVPIALMVWNIEDDEEQQPAPLQVGKVLSPDALMSAGVVVLSLGLLVTVAILLVGVNFTVTDLGDQFRARMPLVAFPLALVLTMRLSVKTVGPERAAAFALGALALGVVLWLALPAPWKLLGLGVPVFSVALAWAVVQLVKAARKGSQASAAQQRAGAMLLLAGLCGFALWASPPSAWSLGGAVVRFPLALVALGLPAAIVSFVAGVAVGQGKGGRGMLVVGTLAAVVSFGYGLGAVLGLGALALGWRAMAGAKDGLGGALRSLRGRFYGTGRWAAHVAILLVFIGYGASAYHASEADYQDLANPLQRGVPQEFGPYTLTLADSQGLDRDGDGAFEEVTAYVAVARGGRVLDVAPITFYWVAKESQYRPTEYVMRQPLEDVYLNSKPSNLPKMHTSEDGWIISNQRALFDPGTPPQQMHSDQVDAVALSVKRLPLVAPLWAGAALLPFSMALTIAGAPARHAATKGARAEARAPAAEPAPAPAAAEPSPR